MPPKALNFIHTPPFGVNRIDAPMPAGRLQEALLDPEQASSLAIQDLLQETSTRLKGLISSAPSGTFLKENAVVLNIYRELLQLRTPKFKIAKLLNELFTMITYDPNVDVYIINQMQHRHSVPTLVGDRGLGREGFYEVGRSGWSITRKVLSTAIRERSLNMENGSALFYNNIAWMAQQFYASLVSDLLLHCMNIPYIFFEGSETQREFQGKSKEVSFEKWYLESVSLNMLACKTPNPGSLIKSQADKYFSRVGRSRAKLAFVDPVLANKIYSNEDGKDGFFKEIDISKPNMVSHLMVGALFPQEVCFPSKPGWKNCRVYKHGADTNMIISSTRLASSYWDMAFKGRKTIKVNPKSQVFNLLNCSFQVKEVLKSEKTFSYFWNIEEEEGTFSLHRIDKLSEFFDNSPKYHQKPFLEHLENLLKKMPALVDQLRKLQEKDRAAALSEVFKFDLKAYHERVADEDGYTSDKRVLLFNCITAYVKNKLEQDTHFDVKLDLTDMGELTYPGLSKLQKFTKSFNDGTVQLRPLIDALSQVKCKEDDNGGEFQELTFNQEKYTGTLYDDYDKLFDGILNEDGTVKGLKSSGGGEGGGEGTEDEGAGGGGGGEGTEDEGAGGGGEEKPKKKKPKEKKVKEKKPKKKTKKDDASSAESGDSSSSSEEEIPKTSPKKKAKKAKKTKKTRCDDYDSSEFEDDEENEADDSDDDEDDEIIDLSSTAKLPKKKDDCCEPMSAVEFFAILKDLNFTKRVFVWFFANIGYPGFCMVPGIKGAIYTTSGGVIFSDDTTANFMVRTNPDLSYHYIEPHNDLVVTSYSNSGFYVDPRQVLYLPDLIAQECTRDQPTEYLDSFEDIKIHASDIRKGIWPLPWTCSDESDLTYNLYPSPIVLTKDTAKAGKNGNIFKECQNPNIFKIVAASLSTNLSDQLREFFRSRTLDANPSFNLRTPFSFLGTSAIFQYNDPKIISHELREGIWPSQWGEGSKYNRLGHRSDVPQTIGWPSRTDVNIF